MNDNHPNQPATSRTDPYAAKTNFDVNEQQLHKSGVPGLWRQICNLSILVAIIALVIVLVRMF
ncbi:hypothetical protein D3C77_489610 [compost metagenome]